MSRAQITIEFMFVIGIIMLIFIIFLGFALDKRADLRDREKFLEKRNECFKVADLVTSVFAAGHGAEATHSTDYIITIFNSSRMQVEEIGNVSSYVAQIAVLASEAGETSLSFYNDATSTLNPDWYRTCFSDISRNCPGWISDNIQWDLEDLMENISSYNTIYLEDSHIGFDSQLDGKPYLEILGDWVSEGNILILAEHVMCREQSSGIYPSTSYRCNPPDYNSDVWNIFGQTLSQEDGNYNNDMTIVKEDNGFNFLLGESYDFEEPSYIVETANLSIIGRYDSSSRPAITYWNYGKGRIYYFGDFQVKFSQDEFSAALTSLILKAYSLLTPVEESETMCTFYANSPYYKLTGDLLIKNVYGEIMITNATIM